MNDSKKIFNVRVKTQAKQNKVIESDGVLRVYTTVAPENGRANSAVIELLSKYFDVAKSNITISKGFTSRDKVICIQ